MNLNFVQALHVAARSGNMDIVKALVGSLVGKSLLRFAAVKSVDGFTVLPH